MALHELYKYINKYYDQVGRSRALTGGCAGGRARASHGGLLSVPFPQHRLGEGWALGLGSALQACFLVLAMLLPVPTPTSGSSAGLQAWCW